MGFFALPIVIGLWALSSLVPVSTAAPRPQGKRSAPINIAHGLQLTPADFNETIARDYWFVEFYSPLCPHCQRFAPTWQEFTDGPIKDTPRLHFAQVNCMAHGDLCWSQGVLGFPELNLFHDGSKIGRFRDEKVVPKLTAWVEGEIRTHDAPPTSVESTESSTSSSAAVEKSTEPVPAHEHEHEHEHEHGHAQGHEHEHEHEQQHEHVHQPEHHHEHQHEHEHQHDDDEGNIVNRLVHSVGASFDACWAAMQANIMLSLAIVGAFIVLASVGLRRFLPVRADPNVYVPQTGYARLD